MNQQEEIPRPEYPRPQMVRDEWMNLNGQWQFEIDDEMTGEKRELFKNRQLQGTIQIPFCPESELSGINKKDFIKCVWYKRSFTLPENWNDKYVFLNFGAVDYDAKIWINSTEAGTHRGGYSSFSIKITDFLKAGENIITVMAFDDVRSGLQPSGKQSPEKESFGCFYTRTTGIWQTVWLEAVPQTYIQSFKLIPDIEKGEIVVTAKISGNPEGCVLKATALASGEKVGSEQRSACDSTTFSIPLSKKILWEPENPFLYDIEFTLEKNEKPIDKVESYFGLRSISIEDKKVLLNNKSVFQRLVLDQGFYPDGIYTAPSDEALRKDIELSLVMGFNGARLHERTFEPRFLYWADKLGYLVWGEYPNWGLDHRDPSVLGRVSSEWLEILERDFNHPSIIGWCPFNETTVDQEPQLIQNIYRITKAADPTRPVIDTSGYFHVETDIYDVHNYEQDPEKFKKVFELFKDPQSNDVYINHPENDAPYKGQPYWVSEYGGIWWDPAQVNEKSWGYGERPKTEEEFLERYKALTEALLFHPKMFGFCYTQLYDVEQETNGLYTYDRKPKFDPAIIKKINSQKAAIE